MNEFLQIALTFPTVVYSVLLAVSAGYWLLAATGLADLDAGESLPGGDGDAGAASGAAAMVAKLGLASVPVMVVATVLALTGWLGTYFAHLLVLRSLPDAARVPAGIATAVAMLAPAAAATSVVLRPLSRKLARLRTPALASLHGQTGVLVTSTLTSSHGQASVDDGGAGLILQVRHDEPNALRRGDRVVLIEYLDEQNAWRVVSEQNFLGR